MLGLSLLPLLLVGLTARLSRLIFSLPFLIGKNVVSHFPSSGKDTAPGAKSSIALQNGFKFHNVNKWHRYSHVDCVG